MQENNFSLQEKLSLSYKRLEKILSTYDASSVAMAWTAGKDSTTVLYLWKNYLRSHKKQNKFPIKAINLDTGCKFPKIIDFRDNIAKKWDIDMYIARPDVDFNHYPIAEEPIRCCYDLKILPLKKAVSEMNIKVLLTGLRADEHPDRETQSWLEKKPDPDYYQLHVILHWTEMDVWSFHIKYDLPYCELYDQGYRSIGCQPCTQPALEAERSGRNPLKEEQMEALRNLGYF